MAGTVYSFVNAEFKVRWREPYITEGLNAKLNAIIPPGVYRGFVIGTSAAPYCVSINQDPTWEDHVAVINTDGYSLTARKTDGDFDIDLTDFDGDSVVLVIEGSYTIGSTTTVRLIAYTLAEWQALSVLEQQKRVPLGLIAVSISIGASDISDTYRVPAWKNISAEAFPKKQLVKNSGFEEAGTAVSQYGMLKEWTTHDLTPVGAHLWAYQDAPAPVRSGTFSAGMVNQSTASKPLLLQQDLNLPCNAGDKLYTKIYLYRVVAASAGSLDLRFEFIDYAPSPAVTYVSVTIPMNVTDTDWVLYDLHAVAPSGYPLLRSIQLYSSGLTYGGGAAFNFYVDDFEVWNYSTDLAQILAPEANHYAALWTHAVNIGEDLQQATWAKGAKLRWKTTNTPNGGDGDLYFDNIATTDNNQLTGAHAHPRLKIPQMFLGPASAAQPGFIEPRIEAIGPGGGFWLYEQIDSGNYFRRYLDSLGSTILTYNAVWNSIGSTWGKSTAGVDAFRWKFAATGLTLSSRASDVVWTDAEWENINEGYARFGTGGNLTLQGDTTALLVNRPDNAGAAVAAQFKGTLVPYTTYAWTALFQAVGTGQAGFNISARGDGEGSPTDWVAYTHNAYWGSGKWNKYSAASRASGFFVVQDGWEWRYEYGGDGASGWTTWSRTALKLDANSASPELVISDIPLKWINTTNPWSNPAKAETDVKNQVRPKNVPKAWGLITVTSGTPAVTDGWNVDSVSILGSGPYYWEVEWIHAFDNANYCPVVSFGGVECRGWIPRVDIVDVDKIRIYAYDAVTAGDANMTSATLDMTIHIQVFGLQTT